MDYMATHWVMFTAIFAILTLLEVLNFAFTAHSAMNDRMDRFGVGFGLHAILIGLTGIASIPMLISIVCVLIQYVK
jgi:hypothetical protein